MAILALLLEAERLVVFVLGIYRNLGLDTRFYIPKVAAATQRRFFEIRTAFALVKVPLVGVANWPIFDVVRVTQVDSWIFPCGLGLLHAVAHLTGHAFGDDVRWSAWQLSKRHVASVAGIAPRRLLERSEEW